MAQNPVATMSAVGNFQKHRTKKRKGASLTNDSASSTTKKKKIETAKGGRKRRENLERIPIAEPGDEDGDDDECDSDGGGSGQGGAEDIGESSSAEAVYESILGEVRDLLSAASEAQCLGRLKMASSYLLLVHARLIGLGKRVDRATALGSVRDHELIGQDGEGNGVPTTAATGTYGSSSFGGAVVSTTTEPNPRLGEHALLQTNQSGNMAKADKTMTSVEKKYSTPPHNGASIEKTDQGMDTSTTLNKARRRPASMLASLERMDRSLVENLAHAAMELYTRRTGRGSPQEHNRSLKVLAANHSEMDKSTDNQGQGSPDIEPMVSKKHKSRRDDDDDVGNDDGEEDPKGAIVSEDGGLGDTGNIRKRKGRAQRPPAAAVPTVPDVCYDVRELLQSAAQKTAQPTSKKDEAIASPP